jgi:hypothetical protein
METTHHRLVLSKSTNGLQNGFITQGKYNQLVYKAISVLEIPNRLYIITDMVMTATYGKPCAKYNEGIHDHGEFLNLPITDYFNNFFLLKPQ